MPADNFAMRVLDAGCGGGILSEEFANLGCDVSGVRKINYATFGSRLWFR